MSRATSWAKVSALLSDQGVEWTDCTPEERQQIAQKWLETFARLVKQKHDVWIYNHFRWHGFSHHIQLCIEGEQAKVEYQKQYAALFYIFNEDLSFCVSCRSQKYPDLSQPYDDLYVVHHNMKWTMVFTHEQPSIGPFFAVRTNE